MEAATEKLQKVLARHGLGSRRELEEWIQAGRVSVNGKVAELGARVAEDDLIRVDGRRIQVQASTRAPRVLRYHKPVGEVSTRKDPEGRPTVFDALPRLRRGRWIAVGRLDVTTSGLLLFTDDGELANRLMHPSYEVQRRYAVRVLGRLSEEDAARMREGITIDGQLHRIEAVVDAGGEGRNHWYHLTLAEGRNREVRKLFEACGLAVSRLIRLAYGPVELGRGLRPGRFEDLEPAGLRALFEAVDLNVEIPEPKPRARRKPPPKRGNRAVRRGDDKGRAPGAPRGPKGRSRRPPRKPPG